MNNVIATENELNTFLEMWTDISERAAKIASAMHQLEMIEKGNLRSAQTIDASEITVDEGRFYAEFEVWLGCGDYESYSFLIPESYFFDDNFLEDAAEKIKERKTKAAEEKRKAKEAQKLKTQERERAQYLKLKEKFG